MSGASPSHGQLPPLDGLLNDLDLAPPPPQGAPAAPQQPHQPQSAPRQNQAAKQASDAGQPFPLRIPRVKRTPPRNTSRLMGLLDRITASGLSREEAVAAVVPPFPIAGPTHFSDDWMNARFTPYPHLHEGTDLFAAMGTPIMASVPGSVIGIQRGGAGGNALWIMGEDQTAYYYAHLRNFAPDIRPGRRVEKGNVIGFVGTSGNAVGGSPHLHFEMHPAVRNRNGKTVAAGKSTPPVNPKPTLDVWLAEAERNAAAWGGGGDGQPGAIGLAPPLKLDLERPRELIIFSSLSPAFGALGLARQVASKAGKASDGSFTPDREARQLRDEVHLALEAPYVRLAEMSGETGQPGILWLIQPPRQPQDPQTSAAVVALSGRRSLAVGRLSLGDG